MFSTPLGSWCGPALPVRVWPPGSAALSVFHLPDASFSRTPSLGECTCTRSAGLGLDRLFRPHFSSGSCSGFRSHSALPSDSSPPLGVCAFWVLTHISHVKDAPTQDPDPSVPGLPPHGKYLLIIKQSPGFRPRVACSGHGHSASGSPCRRRGDPVAGLLPLPR